MPGKPKVERICKICGEKFLTYAAWIRRGRGKCCSRKCADRWHSFRLKGRPIDEETRRKISKAKTGIKRPPFSLEWRYRLGQSNPPPQLLEYQCEWCGLIFRKRKCGKIKERQRHFCCDAHRSKWRTEHYSGEGNPMYGVSMGGELHHGWKGGVSFEPYSPDFNEILKNEIRLRDNFTCRICGFYGKSVHHIDYNKLNNDPKNLITLCRSCHGKTNYKRDYWIEFFTPE